MRLKSGALQAGSALPDHLRVDEPTDLYGRTLAIVKLVTPDGSEDRLATRMTYHGGAGGMPAGSGVSGVEAIGERRFRFASYCPLVVHYGGAR